MYSEYKQPIEMRKLIFSFAYDQNACIATEKIVFYVCNSFSLSFWEKY